MPELSIVVPAHNEANYLPTTLKSIQKAISEIGVDAEIVVVNDASTDDTLNIANESGARTTSVDLRNIGAVRNAGAAMAKSDRLVFVDADTIVPTETLRQTILALDDGHVGGGARVDISKEKKLGIVKYSMYLAMVCVWQLMGRWAAGCYMFCTKEDFDSFGGFREEFFAAEELFFSRSLKSRGKFKIVKHPVITSARKLHRYSVLQLMRFLLRPMLAGKKMLRSRTGLEVLYEDER